MVRRILVDSDFESESENSPTLSVATSGTASASAVNSEEDVLGRNSAPPIDDAPQRSARRLVRPHSLRPTPGTYEYDSDIYTEESSIGSFVVYTDDENDEISEYTSIGTSARRFTDYP